VAFAIVIEICATHRLEGGMYRKAGKILAAVFCLGVASATAATADPIEDFYKGKSITVLIGYSAGGGYDLYARLLARHFGRFVPGKPNVVAQNMPGAGSLKAVQYLASVATRDGAVIATFGRSLPVYPLLFGPADFKGNELGYLGSITTDTSLCVSWNTSPVRNWDDLMNKPSNFGGEGKGSDPDIFATLLAKVFGAKVKLVTGYPGTAEMTLAMERKELDGICGISYSTLKSAHKDWLSEKKINFLAQAAVAKEPALPDVPLLLDLAANERQRLITKFAVDPQALARPFAAPPAIPAERLAALRTAFDAMTKDPEFLADARKGNLDVNPYTGAQVQKIVEQLYASPADIVKEAAQVIGGN
jgi:tripartite-type tricarboxylate transporter receptor subunit TctC